MWHEGRAQNGIMALWCWLYIGLEHHLRLQAHDPCSLFSKSEFYSVQIFKVGIHVGHCQRTCSLPPQFT